ncbi:MAG: NAD-dependent epimerase/dehydratase family protein [Burkholderiales bacterium]|nr:NAD-dependent epimerase/dehydratase family protein [Burkholderiales bacterium]
MKILITGGCGFIGQWLIKKLTENNNEIIVLDNLSPQIHGETPDKFVFTNKFPNVKFVFDDVRNVKILDSLLSEVEAVVHLAAETGTGQSMYQIRHYYDVNVLATAELFEAIGRKHQQVKKIILASSRSVYGEGAYLCNDKMMTPAPRSHRQLLAGEWEPLGPHGEALRCIATPEHAVAKPASVYAATKLANEQLGQVFADAYQKQVISLRFQNVYGEGQSLTNPYTGILSIFSNQMRQNISVNIFEDGCESRDFIHVSDAAVAIKKALDYSKSKYGVFNIGSGVATSVLEIAERLKRILCSNSEIQVTGSFRLGDIRHNYADIRLAGQILNFAPQVNLDDGLKKFCHWALQQNMMDDRSKSALLEMTELGLGSAGEQRH